MHSKRLTAILTLLFLAVVGHAQVGHWVNKAHMLQARYDCAAATGTDGRIYIFGGHRAASPNVNMVSCEVYDPATDSWSEIANLPDGLRRHAAVGMPDGRILIAGLSSQDFDVCYLYDIATDTFTQGPSVNYPFDPTLAAAMGNDGKAVIIASQPTQTGAFVGVQEFDYITNTWSNAPQAPFPQQDPIIASDDSGTVYAALGRLNIAPGGYATATWAFDDHGHAWTNNPSVPTSREFGAGAVGGDGRLYVSGGRIASEDGVSLVEAFDPTTGTWSTVDSLNWQRREHAMARDHQGRIYVFGGKYHINNQDRDLDLVECYQPSLLLGDGDDISAVEGTSFIGKVAHFKDRGPSENAINYTASIDWGDGTSSVADIVGGANAGEFDVKGTHMYPEKGSYNTEIKINDADGDAVTLSGMAVVDDAPITGNAIDFTASSGVAFSNKIIAHFTDGNSTETGDSFEALVDWGDGSKVGPIAVTKNNNGGFDIRGGHTYSVPNVYTFSTWINGVPGTFKGTATVTPPPPTVTANAISGAEGSLFTGKVATFSNTDPNIPYSDFTATIEWGDGSTSSGIVGPDFSVKGSHTYVKFGSYTLKVSVTVQGGASNSSTEHATISNAPLTATGFNLTAKSTNFADTVASFTDGNPFGVASDYSAAIFWGDGKSSVGTIVAAGGGFKVVGSHSYAKKNKYVVTVSIKDQGGATASATTQLNVGPVK